MTRCALSTAGPSRKPISPSTRSKCLYLDIVVDRKIDFWQFLLRSRTIQKAESTSVLVIFSRRPLYLMMMPIYTGLISVDSLTLLAPCSPMSVAHLLFAVSQEDGAIFMVGIPVARCAGPFKRTSTRPGTR